MNILNIGSLNIDHVYSVDHAVRPGETLASTKLQDFCGGKGLNQSIALGRAGAKVYHAGKIGRDGLVLVDKLRDNGINTEFTKIDEELPTGHAIIQVDPKGQNCIVIYGGANTSITKTDINCILSNFDAGDILLLQNEISNVEYAILKAHEKGMKIALNPSPINGLVRLEVLKYVDWFILNEVEGYEMTSKKEDKEICQTLLNQYPGCKVVLTLGKQGCIYYDGSSYITHGTYEVPVVDTTAAGDTFTGYFLACIMEKLDVEEALKIASKASALAVSRAGASDSIPTRREVDIANIRLRQG